MADSRIENQLNDILGREADLSGIPQSRIEALLQEIAEGGGGGGSVTVDSDLSSTSENPVQNKAIYSALQSKANSSDLEAVATSGDYNDLSNKPTIPTVPTTDSTVTAGGTNPVNSVAVIAYINSLDATNTAY